MDPRVAKVFSFCVMLFCGHTLKAPSVHGGRPWLVPMAIRALYS